MTSNTHSPFFGNLSLKGIILRPGHCSVGIWWRFIRQSPVLVSCWGQARTSLHHGKPGATHHADVSMSKIFLRPTSNFLSSIFVVAMIRDISGTAHGVNFANAAAYLFFQKWGGVAELHFLQTKNAVPCSACALSVLMANAVRFEKEILSLLADSGQPLIHFNCCNCSSRRKLAICKSPLQLYRIGYGIRLKFHNRCLSYNVYKC
jgi:hypothetical protein